MMEGRKELNSIILHGKTIISGTVGRFVMRTSSWDRPTVHHADSQKDGVHVGHTSACHWTIVKSFSLCACAPFLPRKCDSLAHKRKLIQFDQRIFDGLKLSSTAKENISSLSHQSAIFARPSGPNLNSTGMEKYKRELLMFNRTDRNRVEERTNECRNLHKRSLDEIATPFPKREEYWRGLVHIHKGSEVDTLVKNAADCFAAQFISSPSKTHLVTRSPLTKEPPSPQSKFRFFNKAGNGLREKQESIFAHHQKYPLRIQWSV